MRVLHVIDSLDVERGGLPGALDLVLQMEDRISLEHHVLSIEHTSGNPAKKLLVSSENIYLFPASFPARFKNSDAALRWLEINGRSFDLIVIHAIWYILSYRVSKWANSNQIKYVVWPHGSLSPYDLKKKHFLKSILGPLFIKNVLSNATAVICTGDMEKNIMVSYESHPNISLLPLPVDYEVPCFDSGIDDDFIPKLGIADSDFVFLFMCRISYVKRMDLVLESIAKIRERHANIKLVVAGSYINESFESKMKQIIDQYELSDLIIHTGWIDSRQKDLVLKRSDCFLLPSMGENFGIVLIEALSCGVPVILSKNISICKTIVDHNAGVPVDTTVSSLSTAMLQVLENPERLGELRENARPTAELFSAASLDTIYRQTYENFLK